MAAKKKQNRQRPRCYFCWNNTRVNTPASFAASQPGKKTGTRKWYFICADHRDGWNDPGDPQPKPIYPLGTAVY